MQEYGDRIPFHQQGLLVVSRVLVPSVHSVVDGHPLCIYNPDPVRLVALLGLQTVLVLLYLVVISLPARVLPGAGLFLGEVQRAHAAIASEDEPANDP